jgi:hypothetical protein
MKNKNFISFQTAVRKYVGIHEKVKVFFNCFLPIDFSYQNRKNFRQNMRIIFIML